MSESIPYRQELDNALGESFRRFLREAIRYDKDDLDHHKQAKDALENLPTILTAGRSIPKYNCSYVAAAYIFHYHLSHCVMAQRIFNSIFDRTGVPKELYVCDVGSGTGAGRVGLALALSKYEEKSDVYFDAYEPSTAMSEAADCFWSELKNYVGIGGTFRRYEQHSDLSTMRLDNFPDETLKVVTAFHLSLLWASSSQSSRYKAKAQKSLHEACRIVRPHRGVFTIHTNKKETLHEIVSEAYDWNDSCGYDVDINNDLGFENSPYHLDTDSSFYTNCAEHFGPESVRNWEFRFDLPANSILLCRFSSTNA